MRGMGFEPMCSIKNVCCERLYKRRVQELNLCAVFQTTRFPGEHHQPLGQPYIFDGVRGGIRTHAPYGLVDFESTLFYPLEYADL